MTTTQSETMRAALREWVLAKAADLPAAELTYDTPIFERRHVRSVHVPELLLLIEQLRGAPIEADELRPSDFRDIDTLVAKFAI